MKSMSCCLIIFVFVIPVLLTRMFKTKLLYSFKLVNYYCLRRLLTSGYNRKDFDRLALVAIYWSMGCKKRPITPKKKKNHVKTDPVARNLSDA